MIISLPVLSKVQIALHTQMACLSVETTTLFLNAEQAIANAQAGDYDQQEVAARLQSYIEDNKVCTSPDLPTD